jgi:hypothetical protein
VDAGIAAKRVVWAVIVVLACALCYSIGFQSGWSDATVRSDQRLDQFNSTVQDVTNRAVAEEDAARAARLAAGTAAAAW